MAGRVRAHDQMLRDRLSRGRTVFIGGPRLAGRTTAGRTLSTSYLDWNDLADRLVIMRGPEAVVRHLGLDKGREREATLVIDNFHGERHRKSFLRRFNVRFGQRLRLVVTTLESLQGAVRIHPWSVGECAHSATAGSLLEPPAGISDEDWAALLEHGGFPEPFRKRDAHFTHRWQTRRQQELIENDLPRLAAVRDPAIVQMLALLLSERSATPLIYSDLSHELGVTVDTIRRWLDLLVRLQFGFCVRPWSDRVPKALRKEPKWFVRDWSAVTTDPLARTRTFIACHLLKAVEGWADRGFGRFELRYVRDKLKREVDFLVVRDRRPWFLVAVAADDTAAVSTLAYFQRCTRARHAFHVTLDGSFSDADCFAQTDPVKVSARTLLSQLL